MIATLPSLTRWHNTVFYLFLLGTLCCVKSDTPSTLSPQVKQRPVLASLNKGILVLDRHEIVQDSTAAYYQAVRRKLAFSFYEGYELYIQGKGQSPSQLICHPFLGTYSVAVTNDSSFLFTGTGGWPITGLWEDGFSQQPYFFMELIINDRGWNITQLTFPDLSLRPEYPNVDSLRHQLDQNTTCRSKNWDVAVDCFQLIKQYEFGLFAAIAAGDNSRIEEYLTLQQNFNLAYAGEFSEYYRGNIQYLLAREIISPKMLATTGELGRHDWIRRVYCYWD